VSASEIIKELSKLSEAERRAVLNKLRELSQFDDERWDELLNDPKPRPKLEAFLRESAAEGESPLDSNRLWSRSYAQAFGARTSGSTIKLAKPRAKRTDSSNKIRIISHSNSRSLGAMSTSGQCASAHNIVQLASATGIRFRGLGSVPITTLINFSAKSVSNTFAIGRMELMGSATLLRQGYGAPSIAG
jgi:hypothetical protein